VPEASLSEDRSAHKPSVSPDANAADRALYDSIHVIISDVPDLGNSGEGAMRPDWPVNLYEEHPHEFVIHEDDTPAAVSLASVDVDVNRNSRRIDDGHYSVSAEAATGVRRNNSRSTPPQEL